MHIIGYFYMDVTFAERRYRVVVPALSLISADGRTGDCIPGRERLIFKVIKAELKNAENS